MNRENPDAWKSWEREAMNGKPMPDCLSLPDQMAYIAMRYLYKSYRAGALSKSTATAEKRMIRQQYDRAVEQAAFDAKLAAHQALVTRETELAASTCRKDPTPENAHRLCDVLVGLRLPLE